MSTPRRGMLLGKFLPPHEGHLYLARFAQCWTDELCVVVGTLASEPIPGSLRYEWMRQLLPGVRVVHLAEDLPQFPHEHPDFWAIWKDALLRVMPFTPDVVFASEEYGVPLAALFAARFVPVDIHRQCLPISATAIRADPMANWRFIPSLVRPWFVRRVRLIGAESTGKSTLARHLASVFDTVWAPEYAEALILRQSGKINPDDIDMIARSQRACEDALAMAANRVLICDSDLITTRLWSERLFNHCPDWIRTDAGRRHYDLTLIPDADAPWCDAPHRFLPAERRAFQSRFESEVAQQPGRIVILGGDWTERQARAEQAVRDLIGLPETERPTRCVLA